MQSPLPQRLKSARKLAKLTQEQLSTELGFDRSHGTARISQYETGKHAPDFAMAKKMANALGVPVAYLYCDDELLSELLLIVSKMDSTEVIELISTLRDNKVK